MVYTAATQAQHLNDMCPRQQRVMEATMIPDTVFDYAQSFIRLG